MRWALGVALGTASVCGAVAAPAAMAYTPNLAAQEVMAQVKSVNLVTQQVTLYHFKTGRAVSSATSTYNLASTKITAPSKWVLVNNPSLVAALNNATNRKLLFSNPKTAVASVLLCSPMLAPTKLIPPCGSITKAPVYVNAWASTTLSYLHPGDTIYGYSAVSEAATAHDELTGHPVPLATLQDFVGHTPHPAQTPAEILSLLLGQVLAGQA